MVCNMNISSRKLSQIRILRKNFARSRKVAARAGSHKRSPIKWLIRRIPIERDLGQNERRRELLQTIPGVHIVD